MSTSPFPRPPALSATSRAPRGLNVLLFDPGGEYRAFLENGISARGHRCEVYTASDAAWNAWRSGVLPLLVTTPPGLELSRRIASTRLPGTTEILAALTMDEAPRLAEMLAAGVDDFLLLPTEPVHLEARLQLAEQRLARSSDQGPLVERPELFRLLADSANEAIGVRDASGRVIYVNDRFCQMLGYRRSEVVGRQAAEFMDTRSAERFREVVRQRPFSGASSYNLIMLHKNGTPVPTLHSGRAIHSKQGMFQGSFAIILEVERHKELLEELFDLSAQLLQEDAAQGV